MVTDSASKYAAVRRLLERGPVFIHLDARHDGVIVPPRFRTQAQLALSVGSHREVRDLRLDEDGVALTARFGEEEFACRVPWAAVFAALDESQHGEFWHENAPNVQSTHSPGSPSPPDVARDAAPASAEDSRSVASAGLEAATPVDSTPSPLSAPGIAKPDIVRMAYASEIDRIVSLVGLHLSVLVRCDKVLVTHIWKAVAERSGLKHFLLSEPSTATGSGLLQRQLTILREQIEGLAAEDIAIVPSLDLIAGGSRDQPSDEAREFTEIVYQHSQLLILAFADPALVLPEIVAKRFSVRMDIVGVPRKILLNGVESLLCKFLLTASELERISDFDPEELYRNVSGMNVIRIRQAIAFCMNEHRFDERVSMDQIKKAIQVFKARASVKFELPDIGFEQIGGYEEVKHTLRRAIDLLRGAYRFSKPELVHELLPKGFILHGPPGTGKTLFAKAVAHELNATVSIVSGPEVMDKYWGESERKIRDVFAEARRNAPAVIVFDEFDAIATSRGHRADGATQVGNAMVAQILTEMDGFRGGAPVLVLGTTNRVESIDEAFLRPGRFQVVGVPLPGPKERLAIARIYATRFKLELPETVLAALARAIDGWSGDEIRGLFREAHIDAYCTEPPVPMTPRRFGELVGRMRSSRERHTTRRSSLPTLLRGLSVVEPTREMIPLAGSGRRQN